MAEIVAAFAVPHMPNAPAEVDRLGPESETGRLYAAVREHVDAVDPDVLVVFDTDHFAMFFYDKLPTFSVGIASRTSGPGTDEWDGLTQYDDIPVDQGLARHVHGSGIREGFDLASSQEFTLDHSITVPMFFLNPEMRRPIVPIWVNGIAPPLPLARRCFALGMMVREAAQSWPVDLRVGVVASGAISGDIGGPRALDHSPGAGGDREWVELVERRIVKGEIDELLNDAAPERLAKAGNVTGEVLNWITLLGAVGDRRPVYYESQQGRGNAYAAWRWDA
jgi:Catalytic LigB subunit of aromatic ring-opening dioxygenase